MNKVATEKAENRANLFRETAARMGVRPALVEKDFWVSWTLRQLFSIPALKDRILFKGGTSLSKIYRTIQRFSEDIDLAVNYEKFGFTGERHPLAMPAGRKRKELHNEMLDACRCFIHDELLDHLRTRFTTILGRYTNWDLAVRGHPSMPMITRLHFSYPSSLDKNDRLSYLESEVLLEPVIRSPFAPRSTHRIQPFAAEHFPGVFAEPDCQVEAINAERTFWDKATILHAEYHRPAQSPILARYSRHYSDLAMMSKTEIKAVALADLAMLTQAANHKIDFYPNPWASYESAVPETLRLVPPELRWAELRRDYEAMKIMFIGDPFSFEQILDDLSALEQEIKERAARGGR